MHYIVVGRAMANSCNRYRFLIGRVKDIRMLVCPLDEAGTMMMGIWGMNK